MAVTKVALSLPAPLLRRIDRLAGKARLCRSAFVRRAVETALRQPAEVELVRKVTEIYADLANDDRVVSSASN